MRLRGSRAAAPVDVVGVIERLAAGSRQGRVGQNINAPAETAHVPGEQRNTSTISGMLAAIGSRRDAAQLAYSSPSGPVPARGRTVLTDCRPASEGLPVDVGGSIEILHD